MEFKCVTMVVIFLTFYKTYELVQKIKSIQDNFADRYPLSILYLYCTDENIIAMAL